MSRLGVPPLICGAANRPCQGPAQGWSQGDARICNIGQRGHMAFLLQLEPSRWQCPQEHSLDVYHYGGDRIMLPRAT